MKVHAVQLYALLVGFCQDGRPVAIARGIVDRNGFELWRRLRTEFAPEGGDRQLAWLTSLMDPDFPKGEREFGLALEEWETDVRLYQSQTGKIMDDDTMRAIVSQRAPQQLRQHLHLNSDKLDTYGTMRDAIIGYLQSKRVWKPRQWGNSTSSTSASFMNADKAM
eukprot:8444903-Lingulodinium_polyedra.AAC.1